MNISSHVWAGMRWMGVDGNRGHGGQRYRGGCGARVRAPQIPMRATPAFNYLFVKAEMDIASKVRWGGTVLQFPGFTTSQRPG